MNITLTGTNVTIDSKEIFFQKNNLVNTINVIVDTDDSWQYKIDVRYSQKQSNLYNVINLSKTGGGQFSVDLTADMLPFDGMYLMQLRGMSGDKVYHSETFKVWVKYSIEPGEVYNPVPSEFYQIEDNVTEINANPPYSSDDGYWMIWDTTKHEYVKSNKPVAVYKAGDGIKIEDNVISLNLSNAKGVAF